MEINKTDKGWKLDYEPGTFKALAETQLGIDLWKFLLKVEIVDMLHNATDLGFVAVFGIEGPLLKEFGKDIQDDRTKQMLGHMVRAIMEQTGYDVEKQNVSINSPLFTKGTRYFRRGWHRFHVFRNKDRSQLCFLEKREPESLPKLGRGDIWKYDATFADPLRGAIIYDVSTKAVLKGIKSNGFYLKKVKRSTKGS